MLVRDKHTHMLLCVMIFTYYCVLAFQKKNYLQWRTPPPPRPPLIFRPNWGLKGGKKFFVDCPSPSYLKVWIWHWFKERLKKLAGIFIKYNYCRTCHTRFTFFSPLPSYCITSLSLPIPVLRYKLNPCLNLVLTQANSISPGFPSYVYCNFTPQ